MKWNKTEWNRTTSESITAEKVSIALWNFCFRYVYICKAEIQLAFGITTIPIVKILKCISTGWGTTVAWLCPPPAALGYSLPTTPFRFSNKRVNFWHSRGFPRPGSTLRPNSDGSASWPHQMLNILTLTSVHVCECNGLEYWNGLWLLRKFEKHG